MLEIGRVESPRDQTLVNTSCRAEETERNNSEPETPVEDALGLAKVLQVEDVDWFLDTSRHLGKMFLSWQNGTDEKKKGSRREKRRGR